ncbi:Trp biosynthesis-associated membrane protein [Nocardioides sp. MAHUQ-72]|uniref:Trp biosynthesis-associated membrane protein n=1 Tax=unclassified Nocardioides TaxID=2615069 RepID=UPI00360C2B65
MADAGHAPADEPTEPPRDPARRTFGPVVLLGLVGAGLAAVAGNKPWAHAEGDSAGQLSSLALSVDSGKAPAAGALALVVLACWGVVLVTRGRVRRAVALLGAVASLGTLAAVVAGWSSVVDTLRADYAAVGITDVAVSHTGWFWAAAAGAVLSLVATVLAVRWAPAWPEMGSRYDAPTGGRPAQAAVAPEDQSNLELWKAIDEGRDPTAAPIDEGRGPEAGTAQ